MHIDQRRVTVISFQDGRSREFLLHQDGSGYRLSLVSKDEVVNIFLTEDDLGRLRQEIAKPYPYESRKEFHVPEATSPRKEHHPVMQRSYCTFATADPVGFPWSSSVDWLSFN